MKTTATTEAVSSSPEENEHWNTKWRRNTSCAGQKAGADWKNDLQIQGAGRKSRKPPTPIVGIKPNGKCQLRDDGIMRSKTFLKDVVLIAFPDTHSSWSGITTLNKIRNYFVHREGYLPDGDNKQVEKFVTSPNSGLRLAEEPGSKRIVIASEVFNQNVLKSFETFNDVLLKTLLADAKARIV